MDAVSGCPDDYTELFEIYFPLMKNIVAHSGIAREDVEDVAMDILAKFIEKDGLAYYDPNFLLDTGDSPEIAGPRLRRPKFKGMLRGFTSTYVMQYRDKQKIKHHREPFRLEAPVNQYEDASPWSEIDNCVEPIAETEFRMAIGSSLSKASHTLLGRSTKFRDYRAFCLAFVSECEDAGDPVRLDLSSTLDVSTSTLRHMIGDFRHALGTVIAADHVYYA